MGHGWLWVTYGFGGVLNSDMLRAIHDLLNLWKIAILALSRPMIWLYITLCQGMDFLALAAARHIAIDPVDDFPSTNAVVVPVPVVVVNGWTKHQWKIGP